MRVGHKKIAALTLFAFVIVGATEIEALTNFSDDAVIQNGDEYDYVQVYDHAIIDMTGGIVTNYLSANDYSTVNVSGGVLGGLGGGEFSTLNLSGDMQTNELSVSGSSTANVFAGSMGLVEAWNHSTVNLHGGTISDYVLAYGDESLVVNIYGYDFDYDALGGSYGGGQLTGYWADGTGFSIDLWYSSNPGEGTIDTYSHINLIPFVGAEVQLHPDTLNLASRGKWINCKIWLPEDYNVADVNSETIFLEDEIPAEWIWFNEKQNVVMAKFRRSALQEIIQPGRVELTVTGELLDGTPFEGKDTIRVINKGKTKQLTRKRTP